MCPMGDTPDCFHCPLKDCAVNTQEINRQEARKKILKRAERDKQIVELWEQGASVDGLMDRYGLTRGTVCAILRQAGIDVKKEVQKRRRCWR